MRASDNLCDVVKLISDIKHGALVNSYDIAVETESLLEKLIIQGKWATARELMELIKLKIQYITEHLPQEATPTNVMRHILKVIRAEYEAAAKRKGGEQSLHHLVSASNNHTLDYSEPFNNLKTSLVDHLTEYKCELESSVENVAAQAIEHIHSKEIILTFGKSNIVEKFLKSAAKDRDFQVIVVEAAPQYLGHTMAANLAKSNIQTIIIPDTAVFAMMSRVNKVIIGTHSVLADGGLRAASGIHGIALAAKHYSVPVMVLAHMYKFTPVHVGSQQYDTFNVCASPANVIPYSVGLMLNKIDVYDPLFDYVPPELVTLFITHQGGNASSYVYRLLSELYHPDDYDI